MQKQRISLKEATAPKKSVVATPRKRIALATLTDNTETESEPVQKFSIDYTERTFLIRFGTQQFGVVKHDTVNRFENQMRNCESKEQKNIASVITIMKTYLKAGMSFEQLQARMSKNDALFAPSVKVFINRINKA